MLIDWNTTLKYCPNITGIIHVGAHTAEESEVYGDLKVKWVEADPDLYQALRVEKKYHFAATNYKGTVRLNRMPFRAANSLLEPNLNKRRKDVYVEQVILVPADKISSIQEEENFLNLDIQGAELQALQGVDLSKIQYIYTECHKVETYHDCTKINELDEYLEDFERVDTVWTKYGWGDCLYVKKRI